MADETMVDRLARKYATNADAALVGIRRAHSKPALTADALVCIRGRWVRASVNGPPDNPPADFALVTSGNVIRSGHHDSLGALLGFTREDVEALRATCPACETPDSPLLDLADRIEALLPPESQPAPTPDSE